MPNTTWKSVERRTAAALGGQRVGPAGKEGPDVDAGWLVAECKHRRRLPAWIADALAKVRAQAGPHRLGLVIAHEHQGRDSWVIMSLSDFRAWYGTIPGNGNQPGGELTKSCIEGDN